ncbi:MAG TPA: hypothetical protein VHO28_00845 [Ignavibacteriales bacterium]|nr:hypothetical protein [Ignavibacteriales bacterium]
MPGKLFEYLRAGTKIIAFGDENEEVSCLLKENNAGVLLPYSSSGEEAFNAKTSPSLGSIYKYDRRAIAQELSSILNKL